VIKFFSINTRTGKVLRPLPIRWKFPSLGWVKINNDGAAKGYSGLATCGGIFHGSMGKFIEASSAFLEVQTVLVAEFYGIIHAMKEAQKMGFTARTNVPWMFRNQWNTCLNYSRKIRFRVTHIFREGNACADKLANLRFIHRNLSIGIIG